METFYYDVYGLTIASALRCPELPVGGPPADVRVRLGEVPESLGRPAEPELPFEATPGRFLFRMEGVAGYLVSGGEEIVIDRAPDSDDGRVRLYLLGAVIGALFHQRGTLVLHGSAIETPQGAVLFTAPRGSGKSTLARAFLEHGYRVLTDDICAVLSAADGRPAVAPGYPQMKLWADAAGLLERDTESLEKVSGDRDKYVVPVSDRFCPHSLPLRAIYVLDPDAAEASSRRLDGVERFDALVQDTYRTEFLGAIGAHRDHFRNIAAAARAVPVSRLGFPRGLSRLDETVACIEEDLAGRATRERRYG